MERIIITVIASLWVIFFTALYLSKRDLKKRLLNLKPKKSNVYVMKAEKPVVEKKDDDIKIFQGFKQDKDVDNISGYKVLIPKSQPESKNKSNVLNVSKEVFINKPKSKKKRKKENDTTIKIGY